LLKRVKRRYLQLKLDGDSLPSDREFLDASWGALTRLFGEFGASLANLALFNYDIERKTTILRVNLVSEENVRAALATITTIGGKPMAVHVLSVSGTLKSLREKSKP
jgi:RNase P/RNase MRP subunit POP5